MVEEWRECGDFPAYEVSDKGRVRNKTTGFVLKPWNHRGYWTFQPSKDGKSYTKEIHILLAKAFIPNHENKLKIDHIDGNSLNNCIQNLRWATSTEQAQNRKKFQSKSGKSGVYISSAITFNGVRINLGLFDSVEEASEMYEAVAKGLFGEFYRN
jgi:hypothetical protein